MGDFIITRSSQAMVFPSKPTPTSNLPLSCIDKALGMRNMVELFQVFHSGHHHPTQLIRQALAKALVPYYPVAGRLVELHVACTGEGVWFSEATANCSLEDLSIDLYQPLFIPIKDHLLPTINVPQNLILMIQVTEFTCGGFVVCFGYNHAVFDGFGIMNFFRAVGEMARGLEKPVIEPIWCREIIPGPPPKPAAHPSSSSAIPNLHLELSTLDFHLDKMKEGFMKTTGRACSDFDVMVAVILQCRTRAINPEHAETLEVHLICPCDVKPLLHELIPGYEGYYGNCTFHALVTAPASKIMQASVTDIVGWILDAKGRVSDGFWKWLRGELSDKSIVSFCNYETIVVTDMDKLGCKDVNYGWGAPVQSGMLRYGNHMVYCVVDSSLKIKGGVRITGRLVREEHLQAFNDEMNKACN